MNFDSSSKLWGKTDAVVVYDQVKHGGDALLADALASSCGEGGGNGRFDHLSYGVDDAARRVPVESMRCGQHKVIRIAGVDETSARQSALL
ncbi:MAG: hypothetical protein M3256_03145 [Actinomycetota bacterium]|nr:hypothetical protein [Actinomycetota bacterium]